MNTQEMKNQAHKEFDEKFGIKTEHNRYKNVEYVDSLYTDDFSPENIKSFIDSLVDKAVQMSEERAKFLLNDLQETFYTEIQKVDNRYKNSSVDIQQAKWSHSNEIRLIFSKLKSNFLESLITNKSDINK